MLDLYEKRNSVTCNLGIFTDNTDGSYVTSARSQAVKNGDNTEHDNSIVNTVKQDRTCDKTKE